MTKKYIKNGSKRINLISMNQHRNNGICIDLIAFFIEILYLYREKTIHPFRTERTIEFTIFIFLYLDEAFHMNHMETSINEGLNFVLVHVDRRRWSSILG